MLVTGWRSRESLSAARPGESDMAIAVQKIKLSPSRDISFNKLVLSQSNVRRVKAGVSIEQLVENIAQCSLLQSLSVRAVVDADGQETGMFEVPAGGRRYRALELLVKQKRMAKTQPIPCVVRDGGIAERWQDHPRSRRGPSGQARPRDGCEPDRVDWLHRHDAGSAARLRPVRRDHFVEAALLCPSRCDRSRDPRQGSGVLSDCAHRRSGGGVTCRAMRQSWHIASRARPRRCAVTISPTDVASAIIGRSATSGTRPAARCSSA